ncbi:hypothetical protein IWW36_005205, partial [Coemansia brasiliensis]
FPLPTTFSSSSLSKSGHEMVKQTTGPVSGSTAAELAGSNTSPNLADALGVPPHCRYVFMISDGAVLAASAIQYKYH